MSHTCTATCWSEMARTGDIGTCDPFAARAAADRAAADESAFRFAHEY